MFDKVGGARLTVGLIARADADKKSYANRVSMGHGTGDNPEAVVQSGFLVQSFLLPGYLNIKQATTRKPGHLDFRILDFVLRNRRNNLSGITTLDKIIVFYPTGLVKLLLRHMLG